MKELYEEKLYGWRTKEWKFKTVEESEQKRKKMEEWIQKNSNKYQIEELFVNNAWAVTYRPWIKIC